MVKIVKEINKKYKPERSCAACGIKGSKEDFFRFVLSPELEVAIDVRGRFPGRGVYICQNIDCIKRAIKKSIFNRFFKKDNINCSFKEVLNRLEEGCISYFYTLMNSGIKSGKIICGTNKVYNNIKYKTTFLVLLSKDAGRSTKDKIEYEIKKSNLDLMEILDKQVLADKLGISVTSIFGVTDDEFAVKLKEIWRVCTLVKLWYN